MSTEQKPADQLSISGGWDEEGTVRIFYTGSDAARREYTGALTAADPLSDLALADANARCQVAYELGMQAGWQAPQDSTTEQGGVPIFSVQHLEVTVPEITLAKGKTSRRIVRDQEDRIVWD